jgi:uncharacterized protein (DUF433 family)
MQEPTQQDPETHSGDRVFSGTRVPVQTLLEIVDEIGSVPEGLDEFVDGYPTVERWKAEAVLVLRGQDAGEADQDDVPARPWLSGRGRITTEPGFLDLVDWLQRGSMDQWRELYAAARQHPEIWPDIRRAVEHVTDPDLPSSRPVWEYLLQKLEREGP